ncbi:spore germination protein GerPE [Paenibacillus sp. J2TS4]|uniref:spore germination protein GerPE n=1 Tax=Paenibacillus sp. J2TS4 TaxID=2807194 RepID=UPI001B0D8429|nr:spore germination protein GerPE [Paenibacillus sp. J2TS4]GIP33776.1 hypothetical protein J2TS4_29860 [Paenibacillus sp. J2TS4]
MSRLRISVVGLLRAKDIEFSSIVQIGDSLRLTPESLIFAVQRNRTFYYGREGEDLDYPIFRDPIPSPPRREPVNVRFINESPFIKVGAIDIQGVSVSGIVQIGSNQGIDAESRVKHIRQFILEGKSILIGSSAAEALKVHTGGAPAESEPIIRDKV